MNVFPRTTRSRPTWAIALVTCGVAAVSAALVCADEPNPDQLRAKAKELIAQARDLKGEGALEKSQRLAEEAKRLETEANRIAGDQGGPREKKPAPVKDGPPKAEQLRAKIADLSAAGRMDEAAKLKQQLAQMDRPKGDRPRPSEKAEVREDMAAIKKEIMELRRQGRAEEAERLEQKARARLGMPNPEEMKRPEPLRDRPIARQERREVRQEFARVQPPRPDREFSAQPGGPENPEQRLRHLRVAIENLHAAGLHEEANRLAQQSQRLGNQVRERRGPGQGGPERPGGAPQAMQRRPGGPEGPGEAMQSMQRRMDEMSNQLRELRERLEQLSRRDR